MSKDYEVPMLMTDEEEEFAKLFAEAGESMQTAPRVSRGELVQGRIIKIGPESTFVDLGGKAEGVIETRELEDLEVGVGDTLEAVVLSTAGEVRLSRHLAVDARSKELLADAYEMKIPVEGKISGRNKGGFEVAIGGMTAFMPVSHLAIESIEDLDAWIGRTERFLILEYDPSGKRLVLSRANLQRRDREEAAEKLWETLETGQILTGKITSIQDYGCFVDIGGADGLVHIGEMQWGRLGHPSELVEVGQEVRVAVMEIDAEKRRIGLSMKTLDADPWKQLGTSINEGDTVDGTANRIERYGVFVELLPGVEGLVHISEMTHLRRLRHPNELVSEGDVVKVTVLQIDHVTKRVSLSMKAVEGDPWDDVEANFLIGAAVTGTVERVAPFGVFVAVAPGVTALLPGSETGQAQGTDLGRFFKPGELVSATVLSVDAAAKRMSLSIRAAGVAAEERNITEWNRQARQSTSGFGTFADLLKNVKLD